MQDATALRTPPETTAPTQPRRSNKATIPVAFHDEIWRLYQEQGLGHAAIAAVLVAAGVSCTRFAVRRTVRRLARQRVAADSGLALRQELIEQGREASVMVREYSDQRDQLLDRMERARRKGDDAEHQRLNRQLRRVETALSRADRHLILAEKLETEATLRAEEAAHQQWLRGMEKERLLLQQRLAERKAEERVERDGVGGTPADRAPPQPSTPPTAPAEDRGARIRWLQDQIAEVEQRIAELTPTGGSDADGRSGAVQGRPSSAKPAAAAPSPDSAVELPVPPKIDPQGPQATFTAPPDGAVLQQAPALYSGQGTPNSELVFAVDGDPRSVRFARADEKGSWRMPAGALPDLEPGQHEAAVSAFTPDGRLGPKTVVRFTLLSLFLLFFPLARTTQALPQPAHQAVSVLRQRAAGLMDLWVRPELPTAAPGAVRPCAASIPLFMRSGSPQGRVAERSKTARTAGGLG